MAVYNKNSFLKNAQNKAFYTGLNYKNLPGIPASLTDKEFLITKKYANRPDLLAHDKFGSAELWWVLVLSNLEIIKDPIVDFKEGTVIRLVTASRATQIVGT
jgi:hypothetical protein|tara:strand:+ start:3751 stop:4056 length:306 start_codon:yes stop_codon:yes gene_type:complete